MESQTNEIHPLISRKGWEEVKIPIKAKNEYLCKTGVYVIYSGSEILYVGHSFSLGKRLCEHATINFMIGLGIPNVSVRIKECQSPRWTETWFIKNLKPVFNQMNNTHYDHSKVCAILAKRFPQYFPKAT